MAEDEISFEEFRKVINKYLETHEPRDLTEHFDISVPTVDRWRNGKTAPVDWYRKFVVERITELLAEEQRMKTQQNQKPQRFNKNRGPQL